MSFFDLFKKQKSEFHVAGKDSTWKEINNEVFRIVSFDRNDTYINSDGKVIAKSRLAPYGYLLVEWPIIERLVKLPIVHSNDFQLATFLFEDYDTEENKNLYDFLVVYAQKGASRLPAITHVLHFAIAPRLTLEKYYEKKKEYLCYDPSIIFGPYVWDGELSIKLNLDLKL